MALAPDHPAAPAASAAGPPLVPGWVALAALPLVLVVTQLGGSVARSFGQAFADKIAGPGVPTDDVVGVLAGMATGAGLLGAIAVAVPYLRARSVRDCYRLWPARPRVLAAAAIGTFSLGPLADALMVTLASWYPEATLGTLPRLHDLAAGRPFLLLWPFFALLPGVAEELFFRGFVQSSFARPGVAVLASATSFALFHLDPHHVAGVFPLGLFLAWVASRFGTLVTIVAHTLNNTLALVSIQVSTLDVGYGSQTPMPGWWLAAGLCAWAGATFVLLREPPGPAMSSV